MLFFFGNVFIFPETFLHLPANPSSSFPKKNFIFQAGRSGPSAEGRDTTKKYPLQTERIPPGEDTLYRCRKNRPVLKSIDFHFGRQCLALVTQGIQVAVVPVVANYHTHTAVHTGERFAEDAQVSVRL